jgi:hypothetical protein
MTMMMAEKIDRYKNMQICTDADAGVSARHPAVQGSRCQPPPANRISICTTSAPVTQTCMALTHSHTSLSLSIPQCSSSLQNKYAL